MSKRSELARIPRSAAGDKCRKDMQVVSQATPTILEWGFQFEHYLSRQKSVSRCLTAFHRLHLHNEEVGRQQKRGESSVHQQTDASGDPSYVDKFGFHVTTCCGFIPQDNTWCDDWPVSTVNLCVHFDRVH